MNLQNTGHYNPRAVAGPITIDQAMKRAMQHHRAGELGSAEAIYRTVLAEAPSHPDALHLLGLIAIDAGKLDEGVKLIRRAISINPNSADYHSNLGNALRGAGRLNEAIAAHRKALQINPRYAEVRYNLANALTLAGQLAEAIAEYRRAIELKPNLAAPHNNLGNALFIKGDIDEAIIECSRALELDPNYAEAHFNLGLALHSKKRCDEAIASLRNAIRLKPDYPEGYFNLANALHESDRLEDAIAAYREALRRRPQYPQARSNLGIALRDTGRLDEATAAFEEALRLKPDDAPIHWNLALNHLLQGNFRDGWREHEWRWNCDAFPSPRRKFSQPQWEGQELQGKRILLHAEQGFGDTIQFARYVPQVIARGGRVILQVQPELLSLMRTAPGLGEVISTLDKAPPFDLHCPLLSLPYAFRTEMGTIPSAVPYLNIDAPLREHWENRVEAAACQHGANHPSARPLRVGIVWAGSPSHKRDRQRSMRFTDMLPVIGVRNARFFSLQKGDARRELSTSTGGAAVIDFDEEINDFRDTAGLIATLDLVLSVDTAVIHLAGALGKPAWLLLPAVPDWRWLMHRDDSPWYPTIRLFRQTKPRDWSEVIQRVMRALAAYRGCS